MAWVGWASRPRAMASCHREILSTRFRGNRLWDFRKIVSARCRNRRAGRPPCPGMCDTPSFALPMLPVATAPEFAAFRGVGRRLLGVDVGRSVLRRVTLEPFEECRTSRETSGNNVAKHCLGLLDGNVRFA